MNDVERLNELRELLLAGPVASGATRLVAILISGTLVVLVLWLVRRRRLREEYTPIWMGVALALVAVSFNLEILLTVTRAIGAWTASSTIFFLGELFLGAICLNYAVRLSRTSLQIKNLAQEVALLRVEFGVAPAEVSPPDSLP